MILRYALAAVALVSSIAFTWVFINTQQHKAHAAGISLVPTTKQPWGVALDGTNHIWVAEPNCDSSPVCKSPPSTGEIGEYDVATLNKVHDFIPPAPNIYTPIFLAFDGSGIIWFTDPTHGAIGSLNPGTGSWSEFPIGVSGAQPYDLVFDQQGHLWFTDYANGAIGEFDTSADNFLGETPVPSRTTTAQTIVYGITIAPDGTIWFAENNTAFIGSFTPPASGSLTTGAITEHPVLTKQQHLITVDKAGNVWFSSGFDGQIGELARGSINAPTYSAQTFCVSTSVTSPHISGIAVDSTGKVWFDDSINARVGYLDPTKYKNDCQTGLATGVTYTTFSSGSHPHDGLIVDSHDNVWFTEQFGSKLGEIPAGTVLPPPANPYPPGPTARTWYFAEGRVGGGFVEYLTLGNPDPTNDCVVNIQYLLQSGAPITKQVTVLHASRLTESVNADLNKASSDGGLSVATMVTNDASSPCLGVVAERPMYFNYAGDASDSDVVGATHLASSFYFADVPTGGGYLSFLAILNPPGGQRATVTATYYANGSQVGTQTAIVNAGARGTIAPALLPNLPQHVIAVVTSDQPVAVERPSYFRNISAGIAGTVTGASSVVGSQHLQHEWFFAEGYVGVSASGGQTQENFVISTADSVVQTAATVTINLEYLNGTKHAFTVTVPPKSQLIWDVNAKGTGAASKEVSADITSTGAGIVVERQMYFQYAHTLNGKTLHATGGTEVTGQTATYTSYNFAEGYSNTGYNEWLTLQNPTAAAETIYVIMVNGYGRIYTQQVTVNANTRFTVDISALVLAHLVQTGDDHRGYEVSMTVETLNNGGRFVAERPMYSNTNGVSSFPTQGGSDVFGYTGG